MYLSSVLPTITANTKLNGPQQLLDKELGNNINMQSNTHLTHTHTHTGFFALNNFTKLLKNDFTCPKNSHGI
jgi:hypothetical protein